MGLPLMSRNSSASTLGPLSIARPEPSKMRPSMSSDTPNFKLSPVNSTLVCLQLALHPTDQQWYLPHLLYVDAGRAFEDLFPNQHMGSLLSRVGRKLYLHNSSVSCHKCVSMSLA